MWLHGQAHVLDRKQLDQMEEQSRKSTFRVLFQRNFLLLWSGQALSGLGDAVASITIVLWITTGVAREQSWAPLAVGGIWLMSTLPALVLGPIAGVFADRWEKRQTLLRVNALNGILTVLLFVCATLIPFPALVGSQMAVGWQLGIMYAILLLMNVCNQVQNPSLLAFMAEIIEETDRPQAFGLLQAMSNGNALLGPSLGALLFFGSGVAWTLLFDALSFGILCLCLLAITVPQGAQRLQAPVQQGHFRQDFFDGLRFFKEHRQLITITVSCTLLFLGAGAHNALDVFFVTQNLHTNASFYGVLSSSYAVGLIVGSFLGSVFVPSLGNVRAFCGGLLLWGLFMLLYARLESPLLALVVALLLGCSNAILNVAAAPLLLGITPQKFIGRVTSVFSTAMTVASLVSVSVSSFFASTVLHNFHEKLFGMPIGSIDTIFTCVGILALLGGWYSTVNVGNPAQKKETMPIDMER